MASPELKIETITLGTGAAPKKGDKFHCDKCGMALQITADCKCQGDDHAHFHCCGEEMKKG